MEQMHLLTYCWPSERNVVTVLQPRLVEAVRELLKESVGLVENRKTHNVHPIIQEAVQSLEREFLKEPQKKSKHRRQNYEV